MITPQPKRRRNFGTWFVAILGLLEIAAAVAFFEVKGAAATMCALSGVVSPHTGGAMAGIGGAMVPLQNDGTPGTEATLPPASALPIVPSSQPQTADTGADAAGANGTDSKVSGDTNQIVDPNCVARTTASLLTSGTPSPAGPTCGPMKQPEALKAAEKQISQ